jgi:hypothetical protein
VRIKMEIKVTDLSSSQREKIYTKFVYRCWWRFLTTVRKADVQGKGYGGFCKWAMAEMY